MVRHIVMWNFKEGLSNEEIKKLKGEIKEKLEVLKGKIEGVVTINVVVETLESGNRQIMLDSLFQTKEHLDSYQVHPEHLKVAEIIKSATCDRVCIDYVE